MRPDFTSVYLDLAPAVRAWAGLKVRGPLGAVLDADDLVQEVCYQAVRGFDAFDPARGEPRAWFFGVANHVAQALLRSVARARANLGAVDPLASRAAAVPAEVTTISRRVAKDEALARLVARIAELDDEERGLVLYRGLEGLPHADVGALLGLAPELAAKRWQRLRERLRELPEARLVLTDS